MATCFNDEWIVPHIPKCGGTSIGERLPRCSLGFQRIPITNETFSSHIRLEDFERLTGIDPLERKVLAVIRDPWAREVSKYSYVRDRYARGDRTLQTQRVYAQTFEEFVCDPRNSSPYIYWENSKPRWREFIVESALSVGWDDYLFWLTVNGKVHPDLHIVRLESLEGDLEAIFGRRIPVERLNTSGPYDPQWTEPAVKALYHKYWWGIRHYEMAA